MRDVRVAAVQFQHAPGDKQANLDTVTTFTRQAAQQGVEILVFPECCITGYWHLRHLSRADIRDLAEPAFAGPTSQALLALSREHGLTLGAGLLELGDDDNVYNTYVIAMPDGQLRRHRKIHAFISAHVSSGSEYTVFDTPHGCRVGVLICYDNNIGENVRITALQGAEVLLAPHQTGGCALKDPHTMGRVERIVWDRRHEDPAAIEAEFRGPKGREWLMRWLPTRAHDNGLFLVFANGVGPDEDEVRTGNAMVLDPYGRVIAETWKARDELVVADLDASLRDLCTGLRWMRTRRPELYGPITQATGNEADTRSLRFTAM
ncbi:MAG: acyltransferase [Anaerolineae bacterium]|mgnify:CR=1 FL=1|nr:acyltransferase [Anaerolineae bacterium]